MDNSLFDSFNAYFRDLGLTGLALNAGLSVLLICFATIISLVLSRVVRTVFGRLGARIDHDKPVVPRAAGHVSTALHITVWGAIVFLVLGVWGWDAWAWATGAGAPFVWGALRMGLIIVLALVAWELAILAIGAAFHTAARNAETPRRAAQLRSLAPMTRGAVRTIIAVFAGMIILSQFGVEIGPLLAGAGVLGIAIGFGAQTLVKDYLTGFSLILEDIVSVGDIVRIGDHGGLVETMALRTIRLRDFDGTLHVIPYSEAQIVRNLTKTFSYYVFNLPISYDSDIDRALGLMGSVGAAMHKDPEFHDSILEPIEVVGVDQLADSGVVLKARIKTAPIQQWRVGREYNKRIKLAFDKAGIEIPVPHMKVLLPAGVMNGAPPA